MIELLDKQMRMQNRQSSKGNQMKWLKDEIWYKADYTGYEGLAEYVVSSLLKYSTLSQNSFVTYTTEQIKYKYAEYRGCASNNFLKKGCQMITLERLFLNVYGESLNGSIYRIPDVKERAEFTVDAVQRITGLKEFGTYLCQLLTIDALFLNEDRHTHNIAVVINEYGEYEYCPIFDHGGCLLSDTSMDYPLRIDVSNLLPEVQAKTLSKNFDEQLEALESLYGQKMRFSFEIKDVEKILKDESVYSNEEKKRVEEIIRLQKRKYSYLFK